MFLAQVESAKNGLGTADPNESATVNIVAGCGQKWIGDQMDFLRRLEDATGEGLPSHFPSRLIDVIPPPPSHLS